ncbi:MAG: hypothetical protein JXR68_06020 [Bacteroidales bacterium]|nr:hypothetical protein [Bacteroidales bacterium]
MTKLIKNRFLRYLFYAFSIFVGVILYIEVSFTFFAKPILKRFISKKIYTSTEGVYELNFDKVKINVFSGHFIITNFKLSPDTNAYFNNLTDNSKNLYNIQLDTFEIKKLKIFKLIGKNNSLTLGELNLANPQLKVLGLKQSDTTSKYEQKSATYETVKTDVISSAFSFVKSVFIEKIIISNGNFDFLKPRADNPNPFSINSVTLILNDFRADSKTFSADRNDVFSEDITLIIDGYELKMNDNIHVLGAKKVYISTKERTIQLYDISLNSGNKPIDSLSKLNTNIFNFKIDNIKLNNANFKEIYVQKQISIGNASINSFETIIYGQKKTKKKEFNKDSLLTKIEIYPMFSNFLNFINIDTLKINHGHFESYKNLNNISPKTKIENYNVTIHDFLIDSASINDTSRILYAKDFLLNIYLFEQKLNDSIHTLTARTAVATTENNSLWATDINIRPNQTMRQWAVQNQKSFNNIEISKLNVSGLSFTKFFNYNQIFIDTISLSNSNISLISFATDKKKDKTNNTPINELFMNFADKMVVKNIDIKTGFVKYSLQTKNKSTLFTGNFRLYINDLTFAPLNKNLTKQTKVSGIDAFFSNIKYNTPDSIYSVTVDTLHYATYKSNIILKNLKIKPIPENLIAKLIQQNKSTTFNFEIPTLEISNTNLSNAFQSDSLSLNEITLLRPVIKICSYPNIRIKNEKKSKIDSIKNVAIEELRKKISIMQVFVYENNSQFNPATIKIFELKRNTLDSIFKHSAKCISNINIDHNKISENDTCIPIITQIINNCVINCINIAHDSINKSEIISIYNTSIYNLKLLKENYEAEKINFNEIYDIIGQFLPKIFSKLLKIENGYIDYKTKTKNGQKIIFRTKFELALNNFNFDTAFIDNSEQILFSESFLIQLDSTIVNLKDKIHQISTDKIIFNSNNSYIDVSNLKISSKYIDTNKLCFRGSLAQIRFQNINYKQLYFYHQLNVDNIKFYKPKMYIYLPRINTTKSDTTTKQPLSLPDFFNEINISNIDFDKGEVKIYKNWRQPFFTTKFNIGIKKIHIDSTSNTNDNIFFIPLQSITFNLKDFHLITKDSTNEIKFENFDFTSISESILISNLFFSSIVKDSVDLDFLKEKSYLKLNIPTIEIKLIDLAKFRFQKQLFLDLVSINNPMFEIESFKKDTAKPFNIQNIDLYKKVSNFIKTINIENIDVNNIRIKSTAYTDTSVSFNNFNKISLFFNQVKIDSTTTITEPKLLYCNDLRFLMSDFKLKTKDSLTVFSFNRVSGSTLLKNVLISNFEYAPSKRYEELRKEGILDTFRRAEIFTNINNIIISALDYKTLLINNNFYANNILIDTVDLQVFNDRQLTHDSTVVQKHLLEPLFCINSIVDVKNINVQFLNLIYNEVNEKSRIPAIITLKTDTLIANNITNDTNKIDNNYVNTKLKLSGKLNDSAEIFLDIIFNLKSRAKVTKISGHINKFNLSSFNSYLYNAFSFEIKKGIVHVLEFEFYMIDTVSYGSMNIAFSEVNAKYFSNDSTNRRAKRFVSWLINIGLNILQDSKNGITYRWGNIATTHDNSFGDFKLWIDALISGFKSAFIKTKDNKNAQKVAKVAAKQYNIKLDKLKKE